MDTDLFFELDWCGAILFWPRSQRIEKVFGRGPIDLEKLGLSERTIGSLIILSQWHDSALNWDDPKEGLIWMKPEFERFSDAFSEVVSLLKSDLPSDWILEVGNCVEND